MFEQQIEKVYQGILSRIDSSEQYIYLRDILHNSNIEEPYRNFVAAEVRWWVYEEQIRRELHQNFDFEDPEMKELLLQLDSLYIKTARFDHQSIKTLINSAVKSRLNMLLRPRTTLKWFVFRGEPTKAFHEICKRMEYFTDNYYLYEGLLKYVEANKMLRSMNDIFSVVEFEKIIENVDNEKIFDLSPKGFVGLIEPVFEFFGSAGNIKDNILIPVEAVLLILDDKGIAPIFTRLEEKITNSHLHYISEPELLDFFYNVMVEFESDMPLQNAENAEPVENEKDAENDGNEEKSEQLVIDENEEPESLEEQVVFTDVESESLGNIEDLFETKEDLVVPEEREDENLENPEEKADSLIELFEKINNSASPEEAEEALDNFLTKYKMNPDDEEIVEFREMIKNKFK